MTTNGSDPNVDDSTIGDNPKKSIVKKIKKNYVELKPDERATLKQLSKRKFISTRALKQVLALLLFDKGNTMTEVMEELALSPQTLMRWRKYFKKSRMESLIARQNKTDEEKDLDKNDHLNDTKETGND